MDETNPETRKLLARIRHAFGAMPYAPAAGIEARNTLPTLEEIADDIERLRDYLTSHVGKEIERNIKLDQMENEARAVGEFFSRAVNLAAGR